VSGGTVRRRQADFVAGEPGGDEEREEEKPDPDLEEPIDPSVRGLTAHENGPPWAGRSSIRSIGRSWPRLSLSEASGTR
jgi:hypothetical protein